MSEEKTQAPESQVEDELEFPDEETAEKWRKIKNYRWPDDASHCLYCGSTSLWQHVPCEPYLCLRCGKRFYTQRDYEEKLENIVRRHLERPKRRNQNQKIVFGSYIFVLSMLFFFDMSWFQFALLSGGTAVVMFLVYLYS